MKERKEMCPFSETMGSTALEKVKAHLQKASSWRRRTVRVRVRVRRSFVLRKYLKFCKNFHGDSRWE